jgi:hypothetical protein
MTPGQKVALTLDLDTYNMFEYFFGGCPKKIENHNVAIIVKGVGVDRNNHAYWLIDETMAVLVQAGIPQEIRKFMYEIIFKPNKEKQKKFPKKLTVDDLRPGFIVWLVTCFFAIAVFVIEVIWFYSKRILGLISLLLFLRNFQ